MNPHSQAEARIVHIQSKSAAELRLFSTYKIRNTQHLRVSAPISMVSRLRDSASSLPLARGEITQPFLRDTVGEGQKSIRNNQNWAILCTECRTASGTARSLDPLGSEGSEKGRKESRNEREVEKK